MAERYKSYIVSSDKKEFIPIMKPVSLVGEDYDTLSNVPLKNALGKTQEAYVDISTLPPGMYKITGYYKYDDDSELLTTGENPAYINVINDTVKKKKYAMFEVITDDSISQKIVTFSLDHHTYEAEHDMGVDDTTIPEINDNIDSIEEDISGINDRLDQHDTAISDINTDLDGIHSSITTINGNIATANSNISSNATAIATNATNISANATSIATNASNISSNSTNIATNTRNISQNATGIAAINGEISTIKGTESTDGSMRYIAKSYRDSLDNLLSAVAKSGLAADVAVSSNELTSTNVANALDELNTSINSALTTSSISLSLAQTPDGNDASTYILTQGGVEKGRIHLAKDLVATKGELVTTDGSGNEGMFIKMTIANGTPFYIPVGQLIDTYRGSGDVATVTTGIEVNVSNGIITAIMKTLNGSVIDDGTVAFSKLAQAVRDKITLVDSAVFTVTESATNGYITVNGTDVAIHGLGGAAFVNTTAFDSAGSATSVRNELFGNSLTDTTNSKTIEGLTKRVDAVRSDLMGDLASAADTKTIEGLVKKTTSTNTDVSNLTTYVGTIPSGASATDVIGYINEVKAGITGSAVIASKQDDVVTLKAGISQTAGAIANNSGTDITLSALAVTGEASDASFDNTSTAFLSDTVQDALIELMQGINSINYAVRFDTVQVKTDTEMARARSNIGAAGAGEYNSLATRISAVEEAITWHPFVETP